MVSASSQLPSWPPEINQVRQEALLHCAVDYALGKSLVLRPPASSSSDKPSTTSVIHGPFSLLPTPFPRTLFEHAVAIQTAYNALYAHVTSDEAFLRRVIGGAVSRVDAFQGELWKIWETVREEGLAQDLTLGLFRSDYMLHQTDDGQLTIQQVEFNTISSSFGPLSSKTGDLHRYLLRSGLYPPNAALNEAALPDNGALSGLVDGLASAFVAYGNPNAVVVMVVQDPERNAFDQRALEWDLVNRHRIRLIRFSFAQLAQLGRLDEKRNLAMQSAQGEVEVALVYYRAGYTPNDYPSEREWQTRLLVERSRAIKCPSVALQLAGAKKVQQVLSEQGATEAFIGRGSGQGHTKLERGDVEALRATYTALYPLDNSELGKHALELAKKTPDGFVLKPQREGGGNNIYRQDIPPFLADLAKQDESKPADSPRAREGYILMDLIRPPPLANLMCPAGQGKAIEGGIISELGIYGTCLFRTRSDPSAGAEILLNKQVGHLLRTKGKDVSEGGVATGYSVLDSPLLV